MQTDRTNLTELAEFFPATNGCSQLSRSNPVKIVPWHSGETEAEAIARHEQKAARIQAQIAARKAAAAGK